MLSSKGLREIVTAVRPIIERQLDDAETIAAFRDKVADAGGDWSALKALIKAQIQDERDESGDGKRVKKILEKASFSTDYAELLGWSIMNEKNFSAEERIDPLTGEFLDDAPVTIIDRADEDGHRLTVTVDPEVAAILSGRREQNTDIASASQGETESPSAEAEAAGANAGGEDVDGSAERARNAATNVANAAESVTAGETATNSIAKPKYVLRPHCLNPGEACGGYSDKHCHACTVAMRKREQAEEVA
ncbi:hypothetical protein GHK45_23630 [Sinorhizobium meliloti]|uniref:Uncharacterized protein n=1 Tax=Rhizobium meliloti TaxID=382 RepID=A0A6A7ZUQ4_RHIML|nr:hypothetical protein [Sinorhizobium meliloti]MQW06606.1 hypothetical protein [Sinorhizobium meliloti]